jgi:hypothetical protein
MIAYRNVNPPPVAVHAGGLAKINRNVPAVCEAEVTDTVAPPAV